MKIGIRVLIEAGNRVTSTNKSQMLFRRKREGFRFKADVLARNKEKVFNCDAVRLGDIANVRLGLVSSCTDVILVEKEPAFNLLQENPKYAGILKGV